MIIRYITHNSNSQFKHHQQQTSWKFQSELLQVISDLILEQIQTEIADTMFSIIMDETRDISKTEQLSLCLSHVHKSIKKKILLDFFETKPINKESLFNLAKYEMQSLNLDFKKYCW